MKLWITALSLLLGVAPPAAAVSLFDVAPLTKAEESDHQMIDVVRQTGSGFSPRHDATRCGGAHQHWHLH